MCKRVMSLFIVLTLLVIAVIPAYAGQTAVKEAVAVPASSSGSSLAESDAKISRDMAIEIATKFLKNNLGIDVSDKKFERRIELAQDYGFYGFVSSEQVLSWRMDFQYNSGDRNFSYSVTVDAITGRVINLNKYEYNFRGENQPEIATITEEQAKDIAKNFLNKVNPDESKQVQFDDSNRSSYVRFGSAQYTFFFDRIVNGLKFKNEGFMIGVNGKTGEVALYSCKWSDNDTFPSNEGIIDKNKAEEILLKEAEMELKYMPYSNKLNYAEVPGAVKLVYDAAFENGNTLDAKEGKMIDWSPAQGQVVKTKDLSESEKEQFLAKWKQVPNLDKDINYNTAEEVMKTKVKELLGPEYGVNSLNYEENADGRFLGAKKTWAAQIEKNDANSMPGSYIGNIIIDASNEQLLSVSGADDMRMQDSGTAPKFTWDEAYAKAIDLIAKYFPDKIKDIRTDQKYIKQYEYYNGKKMPERTYSFSFQRIVNGIPYENNGIFITFNFITGTINYLNCNWDENVEFPAAQGALSKDDAKQAYFNLFGPELIYLSVNSSKDESKPENEIKLVYRLKSDDPYFIQPSIDAFTGKFVDFTGDDSNKSMEAFKQAIKGNWAEKELGILAFQGIIDVSSFKPDQEVSKLDAIKILVNAKGYETYNLTDSDSLKFSNISKDDQNYKYLQMAVKYGIIDNSEGEFKGDEKITREEMAELLVKLLKYNRLAKAQDIFTLSFTDAKEISPDKFGFVAIGKGLGIFNGSDGKFRPKDKVTGAELAVAVYKALGTLKN